MFKFLQNRMREPSTWAGFAVLLETVKVMMPGYAPLIVGVQATFGGLAVVVREAGR